MLTYIKGKYQKSIYQNDNGYHIGLFKVSDTNNEKLADYLNRVITFTGYFHELNELDTYLLYGEIIVHEKYGEQWKVTSYERCKPEGKDSIVEFLTSGLFKGIGEKKAQNIVDVLGKDTLKIIYKCRKCGMIKRNKMAIDDNYDLILKLASNPIDIH